MPKNEYEYIRKTFVHDGHQYEVYGKTEAEANQKLGRKKEQVERGEVGISKGMLVRVWCEEYVRIHVTPRVRPPGTPKKERHTLTKKSAGMYGEKIKGYIKPAVGSMRIADVKAPHLQKMVNAQAGKSFSHVNKLIAVTKAIFRQAYLDHLILFDPSEGLTMPYVEKRTRRSLTEAEDAAFRAVGATHKHGLWAEFHVAFGVRPGEVPPLQVSSLDFVRHRLKVTNAVESGTNEVSGTKTAAGVREIPIPPDMEPRLIALVSGRGPFDYLFPSETGGMMSNSGIARRWKSFKLALDLYMGAKKNRYGGIIPETSMVADDLTLYCTRHTFCTELGAKGIDASIGRFVTGHADVTTLANIYMHSNDAIIQSIADKMYGKRVAKDTAEG